MIQPFRLRATVGSLFKRFIKIEKMQRGKPITPDQIEDIKQQHIPDEVYDAFNMLIAKNYSNGRSKVFLKDVVNATVENFKKTTGETVCVDYTWFNVEDVYRKAGWKVEYEQPDYTESFPSYFLFIKKPL